MQPLEGFYSRVPLCETVSWGFPSYWSWEQAHTKGVSENQLLLWMPVNNWWEMKNIRREIRSKDGGNGEEEF